MSEEPNTEFDEIAESSEEDAEEVTSIFEAFEPPPEVDPNRFGPVPIIEDDDPSAEGESAEHQTDPRGAEVIDLGDGIDVLIDPPASAEDIIVGEAAAAVSTDLPHWTEPATGQVPPTVTSGDGESWQDLSGPRWKGEGPDWAEEDIADVLGSNPLGASDDGIVLIDDDADDFSDLLPPAAGAPQRTGSGGIPLAVDAVGPNAPVPGVDEVRSGGERRRVRDARPHLAAEQAGSGERNILLATGVGLVLAAVALAAFRLSGNLWALGLVTVVAVLAAVEVFDAMRRAGLHPATLLGITAAASFPLAVYSRGDAAVPLMLGLTVVFGALWYIVGADTQRPALNLGLTFLGIAWIGGLASFAALILLLPDGKSMLVAAIIITVASDTFALAGGKAFGSRPFHSASPNKTWEGTIVGFVAAVAAGAVVGLFEISTFSIDFTDALFLGLVGAFLAPMGDLTESMIKRDLGVKDMGQLLPGHGGVLDRIDGLLFVLPGVYYLALVLGLT